MRRMLLALVAGCAASSHQTAPAPTAVAAATDAAIVEPAPDPHAAPGGGSGEPITLGASTREFPRPHESPPGEMEVEPQPPSDISVAVGGVDATDFNNQIRARMRRISSCMEHHPAAQSLGAMRIAFTIAKTGALSAVKITGIDHALASCLEGVLRSMRFAPTMDSQTVIVSYPFNVDPAE
jgi:hypothetical protein